MRHSIIYDLIISTQGGDEISSLYFSEFFAVKSSGHFSVFMSLKFWTTVNITPPLFFFNVCIYVYTYIFFFSWNQPLGFSAFLLLLNYSSKSLLPAAHPLWASLVAQLVKNLPACRRPWFNSWVGKIPWGRDRLPTPVFWPGEFYGM